MDPGLDGRRIQRFDQDVDETSSVEIRHLRTRDIVSLVINKMIGTGIYYTPAQVLILVGSKWGALLVWVFGVIYTYVSAIVYLEYGTKWPYNGGEFTYLLKILPRPNLIFSTAYAYFFVLLSTSGPNSLIFSIYAVSNGRSTESKEFAYKMTAFLLVLVISLVHLLLKGFGLDLNLFLAGFKSLLLFVVCIIGLIGGCIRQGTSPDAGYRDFGRVHQGPGVDGAATIVVAIILVLYAFQGWENANYVTAEIEGTPEQQKKILKSGVLIAITIVSVLYLFFNLIVFIILDYQTIARYNDYVSVFHGVFQKVFHPNPADGNLIPGDYPTTRAVAACIAMSAAGNLIGTVYTNARGMILFVKAKRIDKSILGNVEAKDDRLKLVKREIARHQLVPFSSFFASSSHIGETQDEEGTPTGGLILNCLTSWILILATPIYNNSTEGISFLILLFTYGHSLLGVFLGILFFLLEGRAKAIDISQPGLVLPDADDDASDGDSATDTWAFAPLKKKYMRIFVGGILFAGMNLLIFILPWTNRPTTGVTGSPRKIPIRYVCYITVACYVLGILAAIYILTFARQMVFFGPQGPLERYDTTSDKYAYPTVLRLPDPLMKLKEWQKQNDGDIGIDGDDFRVLDAGSGYYVREKDRRWIFFFNDIGLERLFSVPWREKKRTIKTAITDLFKVKRWTHGRKRLVRLRSRIWAEGETSLRERVRRDLDQAIKDASAMLNSGADASGVVAHPNGVPSVVTGSNGVQSQNGPPPSTLVL
ncbi:hypothetical protein TWF281_003869 [Arthrobotrys megalospora]